MLWSESKEMAAVGFRSNLFADLKDEAQAVVKVMAGRELGIGPFASLENISIVQGRVTLGYTLVGALVKRGGKYNYRVKRKDKEGCIIEFSENGKVVGESSFLKEDAERAGLASKKNWRDYPSNMYFARALCNGARQFCPDALNGIAVYDPDEMDFGNGEPTVVMEQSKLDRLGQFTLVDKQGKSHSLTELAVQNKQAYWKYMFAQKNEQVNKFLVEWLQTNGPDSMEGMREALLEYGSGNEDELAQVIRAVVYVEAPQLVKFGSKEYPADDKVAPYWDTEIEPRIKEMFKNKFELNAAMKSVGITAPYQNATWRQISEVFDYKVIDSFEIDSERLTEMANKPSAEAFAIALGLMGELFEDPVSVMQFAGITPENIQNKWTKILKVSEAKRSEILDFTRPQAVNAAMKMLS